MGEEKKYRDAGTLGHGPISLCPACNCMTHTVDDKCGKCETPKPKAEETLKAKMPEQCHQAALGRCPLSRVLAEKEKEHMELIMAVGKKYKDETRHETALRYIRCCEEGSSDNVTLSAHDKEKNA